MSVKGVQITQRDIDVFRLLQQFPLRSAEHIHKHCFGDTKYSAVGRRLKKLVAYKLIKRVTVTGEGYYRYYIGEAVRACLENDKSLKRTNHNLLKHDS